jgi:DNA-binding NarL/FixJ family response regulator
MTKLRILLADDHAVVREGLKAVLNAQPGFEVVGEAADGVEALARAAELDPDVVVVDISMPGLNGAQVTARLKEAKPDRKVLALTVHEDKSYLRRLLEAGASGYVLKQSATAEIVHAIRAVAAGGTCIDPALAGTVVGPFVGRPDAAETLPNGLSEREEEVVSLIAQGYSNKEIAARLKLSVKTVETYKARSLEKLGMRSRVDLVRYATQRGWLTTT